MGADESGRGGGGGVDGSEWGMRREAAAWAWFF